MSIHYFNGADELILESPKNHANWSSDRKYAKLVTGFGSGGSPEYGDQFNNPDWNDTDALDVRKTELRTERDTKISEVDYIYLRHNEEIEMINEGVSGASKTLTDEKYMEFLEYKMALRDCINNISDWNDVASFEWPVKPTE